MQYKEVVLNDVKNPNLGFLGVGWIGRNRLDSVIKAGSANAMIAADANQASLNELKKSLNNIKLAENLEDILSEPEIDGIVIATPNSFHAEQSIKALEKGISVFCQKPLGRNLKETNLIVSAAKNNNKLLGLDLSYRFTDAFQKILQRIKTGELGKIYAANLIFHNAYGPDKPWFYDINLSGGGCVLDLGIHLIDLALFSLDFPSVKNVSSRLYSQGKLLRDNENIVEDYAIASIDLEDGSVLNLNCSWNLSAGVQAEIGIYFYGTKGGAAFKNINGSYYDFIAEIYHGTSKELIAFPPDDWGGKAINDWIKKLSLNDNFDYQAENYLKAAEVIDKIYKR